MPAEKKKTKTKIKSVAGNPSLAKAIVEVKLFSSPEARHLN